MTRRWLALGISMVLAARSLAAQDAPAPSLDELKTELKDAVHNSTLMFEHNFRVTLNSPSLTGMLEKEINRDIAKQLPVPVTVSIASIQAVYQDGQGDLKVAFAGIPPAFVKDVEREADAIVKRSAFTKAWWQVTKSFMNETEKVLDEKPDYTVKKQTAGLTDLEVKGLDQPFYQGVHLNTVRVHVDRINHRIGAAKLDFSNSKSIIIKMFYEPVTPVGGAEPIAAWSALQIEQDSWLSTLAGLTAWPAKLTVNYINYQLQK